jgi:replication-associated recombination protein RarA
MSNPWYDVPTPRGYSKPECASALQKGIRRGDEKVALFFASELDLAGHGKYVWKRLLIITSEDVGIAEPNMPATIRALYENWKELRESKGVPSHRLVLLHAVLLLVNAAKSRRVDDANWAIYKDNDLRVEMPDYAFDMHTLRGRRMGRGVQHWEEEASVLVNNADPDNPYTGEAIGNMARNKAKTLTQPEQVKNGSDPISDQMLSQSSLPID